MRKKIIMLVDDDHDDRFFFRNALNEIGEPFDLLEAQHGLEALDQLRSAGTLPDFIFLDLNMPLMDGRECLAELKKNEKLKEIPVIIYSTSDFKKDIEQSAKLGAAHYLVKPSDIFKLPGEIVKTLKDVEEKILLKKTKVFN